MRWHCWFLGEDVHGLGTFLVIPTKNSELQSISPPSLRSSQLSYRNSSYNCSTGTVVMTVLQDQQLNSKLDSRSPKIKDTCWIIVFV